VERNILCEMHGDILIAQAHESSSGALASDSTGDPWQAAEKVSTRGEREIWSAPTTAALWISWHFGLCKSKAASRCACRRTPNMFFGS
jgi:hypothetical protein